MNPNMHKKIDNAGFSKNTYYILKVFGNCTTFKDVIKYTSVELCALPCFTKRNLKEVQNVLLGYDLALSRSNTDPSPYEFNTKYLKEINRCVNNHKKTNK